MSFDVFLQSFSKGKASDANANAARKVLEPHVVESDGGWARIETADGEADLYGYDTLNRGLMVNHAAGSDIWDLLVEVASAGGMVIMPVGCRTCVTDQVAVDDLPSDLATSAVVVASGTDLLRVIQEG